MTNVLHPSKTSPCILWQSLNPPPPPQRALTAQSRSAQPPVSCRNIKGEGNQPLSRSRPARLQSRSRASLVRLASAADAGLTLLRSAGFSPGYSLPPGEVPLGSAVTRLFQRHRQLCFFPESCGESCTRLKTGGDPQERWPLSGLLQGSSAVTAKWVTLRCSMPGDGTVPPHGVSRKTRREPVTSRSVMPVARGRRG